MSHNPNTINSQESLNPCNDGKRSSEVLLQTIEKCERLQKQLDIAIKGLEKYAEKEKFVMQVRENDIIVGYRPFYDEGEFARKKLKKIEELNEVSNQE